MRKKKPIKGGIEISKHNVSAKDYEKSIQWYCEKKDFEAARNFADSYSEVHEVDKQKLYAKIEEVEKGKPKTQNKQPTEPKVVLKEKEEV